MKSLMLKTKALCGELKLNSWVNPKLDTCMRDLIDSNVKTFFVGLM